MYVCPVCGEKSVILFLETSIGFDLEEDGTPAGIIRDEKNFLDAEELRTDYQQSAEFHCRSCIRSFYADVLPGERYIIGKEI